MDTYGTVDKSYLSTCVLFLTSVANLRLFLCMAPSPIATGLSTYVGASP